MLVADRPAVDLLRLVLLDELAHIQSWRPVAIKGLDPEGVHQVRVSLRRMRTALSLYQSQLPEKLQRQLKKDLKPFAHSLDRTRDLDVLILTHQAEDHVLPEPILEALMTEHRQAHKPVRKLLKGKRFKRFLKRYNKRLKRKAWRDTTTSSASARLDEFAINTLDALYQQLIRQTASLDLSDESALHRLRIECKKLRYACEFFGDLFAADQSKPFIAVLKQLQDHLGQIHDVHVHTMIYRDLSAAFSDEALLAALESIRSERRDGSEQLKHNLRDDFTQLAHSAKPWISAVTVT